ncbi:MAG: LemA family protein, partial [Tatlockia sp.]
GASSAVTLSNNAGTALDLNGFNAIIGSLAGGGATGGNVNLGSGILTTGGNNGSTTYSGDIAGSGALVKTGTGTMTFDSANSYTGGTTLTDGGLNLLNTQALGTTGGIDLNGGTLSMNFGGGTLQNQSTINLNGGAITDNTAPGTMDILLNALVLNTTTTFTPTLPNATLALFGTISGPGGIVKEGDGILLIPGSNSYTGGTTVDNGILSITNTQALGPSGVINLNGGTLSMNFGGGTLQNQSTIYLNGGAVTDTTAPGTTDILQNPLVLNTITTFTPTFTDATLALYGNISGSGSIVKAGNGNLIFTEPTPPTPPTPTPVVVPVDNSNTIASEITSGLGATQNVNGFNEVINSSSSQNSNASITIAPTKSRNSNADAVTVRSREVSSSMLAKELNAAAVGDANIDTSRLTNRDTIANEAGAASLNPNNASSLNHTAATMGNQTTSNVSNTTGTNGNSTNGGTGSAGNGSGSGSGGGQVSPAKYSAMVYVAAGASLSLILLLLLLLWARHLYNTLVKLIEDVNNKKHQVDTLLNRRYDEFESLLGMVKTPVNEAVLLKEVVNLHNEAEIAKLAGNEKGRIAAENGISLVTTYLNTVYEHPDLKANTNALHLQEEILSTENSLTQSERAYNLSVKNYETHKKAFFEAILVNLFPAKLARTFEYWTLRG